MHHKLSVANHWDIVTYEDMKALKGDWLTDNVRSLQIPNKRFRTPF